MHPRFLDDLMFILKNIFEACRIIESEYRSIFPESYEEILKLPGIGRTTAGAIATFAGLGSYPILDANVKRFLIRVYNLDINKRNVENELWIISEKLLCKNRPSDFIQAYMDLGSLICRVSDPKCSLCPVNKYCLSKDNVDNSKVTYEILKKQIAVPIMLKKSLEIYDLLGKKICEIIN